MYTPLKDQRKEGKKKRRKEGKKNDKKLAIAPIVSGDKVVIIFV